MSANDTLKDEFNSLENHQNDAKLKKTQKSFVDGKIFFTPQTLKGCKQKETILKNELNLLQTKLKIIMEGENISNKESLILNKQINRVSQKLELITKKINDLESNNTPIRNLTYSAKTIRMGKLYKMDKFYQKLLIAGVLAIVEAIIVWLFLENVGIYSPGVGGVIQGVARLVQNTMLINNVDPKTVKVVFNLIFWVTYGVMNIPLLLLAYFKVGKQFALLTAFFILVNNLTGFFIGLIPGSNHVFVFGKVLSDVTGNSVTDTIIFWTKTSLNGSSSVNALISLFVYGTICGILSGISGAALYIINSSTGGTDILAYYTQRKKNKSIGLLLTYFNLTTMVIGFMIGSFAPFISNHGSTLSSSEILEAIFSPNLMVSFLNTILMGLLVDYFFPKSKLVNVQIFSKKTTQIGSELLKDNWIYKFGIIQTQEQDLSSNSDSAKLETVCLYVDLPKLIQLIRKVDDDGLITIYPTMGVDGAVPTTHYIK